MRILLTGASGFIGRRLATALLARGHQLVCPLRGAGRPPPVAGVEVVDRDFSRHQDPADWTPLLGGVALVINTVGILRERGGQRFEALHRQGPMALFRACVQAGVPRVLQLSALGADAGAESRYHRSKSLADEALLALPLQAVVVQPSLVFGPGGTSARLFTTLASLPLLPLPGGGHQQVQPIHIDDLIAALLQLVDDFGGRRGRIALVGPAPLTLRAFLGGLAMAMDLKPPPVLPLPMPLVRAVARAGGAWPGSLLDRETLGMLARGNTADATATAALLGRAPRPVQDFIVGHEREGLRARAQLAWALPLLRLSLALVWLVTAALSFGLYPTADSYALLARTGIEGRLAPIALYSAASLDLLLGIATLWPRRRPGLWLLQIALILVYTLAISLHLPEFWRHPYGPVLKNLPLLAVLLLLFAAERRR